MERRQVVFNCPVSFAQSVDRDAALRLLAKDLNLDGKRKIGRENAAALTWRIARNGRRDRADVILQTIQQVDLDCRTSVAQQLDDSRAEDWLARVLSRECGRQVAREEFEFIGWSFPSKDATKQRTTVTIRFIQKGDGDVPVSRGGISAVQKQIC